MAENKTEKPTPKKLRDARKKGEVFKSADLTQALLFAAAGAILWLGGGAFVAQWNAFARMTFDSKTLAGSFDNAALMARVGSAFSKFFFLALPLLLVVAVVAAAGNFFQVRGLFASEVLSPKFERLNPVSGFRRLLFEPRSYIDLAKTIIKILVTLWLGYLVIHGFFNEIALSGNWGLETTAALASHAALILFFSVTAAFLLLGGADYFIQHKLYIKKLKMSKDEVKREARQEEGDPHIRSRRRQIHREILSQNLRERIPRATAVVVNPTHLAIALRYDQATMEAPEVTAKGQEKLAADIIDLAKRHNVPIIRNVPLAHSLFQLDIDTQIPEELFDAVAEILNWVYDLNQREPL